MSKLAAKIKLQTAFLMARDLQAYRAGDTARFDRMVDSHGKSIISLQSAEKSILAICDAVSSEFPVTSRLLRGWVSEK